MMEYPNLIDRIKALFADTFLIVIVAILISRYFVTEDNEVSYAKVFLFILLYFLYDPIMVSFLGGTLGHKMFKLKIKKVTDPSKNITFPLAIIRSIIKNLLGWISLITVGSSKKHLAIHDKFAGSIVLFDKKS